MTQFQMRPDGTFPTIEDFATPEPEERIDQTGDQLAFDEEAAAAAKKAAKKAAKAEAKAAAEAEAAYADESDRFFEPDSF